MEIWYTVKGSTKIEIEDYYLDEKEEEIIKKLKYEKEKDLPMENQIDLFGGVVSVT